MILLFKVVVLICILISKLNAEEVSNNYLRGSKDTSRERELINNFPTPSPSNNDDNNIRLNGNSNNQDRYDSKKGSKKKNDSPKKKSPKKQPFKNNGNTLAAGRSFSQSPTTRTFSATRKPSRPTSKPSPSPSKSLKPSPSPLKQM